MIRSYEIVSALNTRSKVPKEALLRKEAKKQRHRGRGKRCAAKKPH